MASVELIMRYLLLVYAAEKHFETLADVRRRGYFLELAEFSDGLMKRGQLVASSVLQPVATATSVHLRDGVSVTADGPFAETPEQLGAFFLVEARDLDEAIAMARDVPAVDPATVEIRPLLDAHAMLQP